MIPGIISYFCYDKYILPIFGNIILQSIWFFYFLILGVLLMIDSKSRILHKFIAIILIFFMTIPFQFINLSTSFYISTKIFNTIKCRDMTYIVQSNDIYDIGSYESKNSLLYYTKSKVKITNDNKICPQ